MVEVGLDGSEGGEEIRGGAFDEGEKIGCIGCASSAENIWLELNSYAVNNAGV